MDRRTFLKAAAGTAPLLAGCTGERSPATSSRPDTATPAASTSTDPPRTPTEPTDTPRRKPNSIFVEADGGAEGASGSSDDPIASIQAALERAGPGDTIEVAPGEYPERIEPPTGGEPGNPITITGPPDAVLRSDPTAYNVVLIRRSHIHITGLTINGLEEPDAPDEVSSYSRSQLVQARPPVSTDEYLRDIVVAPHRIGNTQKAMVSLERTRNAEVGPFRVIGPAGAKYTVGDAAGHNGEIVYVGTALPNLGSDWHPWTEPDRTRNVRVHHIDNSDGHPHSELVDCKPGTRDVTIEYCTDRNGQNNKPFVNGAVALKGTDATVRWCVLADSQGVGLKIGSYHSRPHDGADSHPTVERAAVDNEVYGNQFSGNGEGPMKFTGRSWGQGPAAQRVICGNEFEGEPPEFANASCPDSVPERDGVGHTGGSGG